MPVIDADWTGQLLSGNRYQVQGKLGEGGMAIVYLAQDHRLGSPVVVKAPRAEMLKDKDFAARFAREIRSLVQLKHPHIVEVFDVGQHEGLPFVVMQYLAGGSLRQRQRRGGGGRDKVQNLSNAELQQLPVETVSWDDALEYIRKLNIRDKDSGWVYRLPREAEWEYACRGGATSKEECSFNFYLDQPSNSLSSAQANIGYQLKRPAKVGSYRPNRLGLYDMHGNVWEWCEDLEGASLRVFRGGGWADDASDCRAAYRNVYAPSDRDGHLGVRLARVPSGAGEKE